MLARIALLIASLALVVGVGEVALRLLGQRPATERRGLHEAHPDRPWLYGMRPGAEGTLPISGDLLYRINSQGFRDDEFSVEKPEGAFRIVVLGDSVAFGYGVAQDDTFPALMQRELEEVARAGRAIEVLNLGVSGYNAYTQAELLEGVALALAPDLVLLQFCINDLNDPTLHFDVQTRLHLGAIPDVAYPDPRARRAPPEPPGALLVACRRSAVCARIDDALLAWRASEPGQSENRAAAVPLEDPAAPEWSWLEGLYRRMAGSTQAAPAEFAVISFPYAAQLDGEGAHVVQRALSEMAARGGWTEIDLLPRFREAAAQQVVLFMDWWHPTAAGHRVAAREIVSQLACADLLPAAASSLCRDAPAVSAQP